MCPNTISIQELPPRNCCLSAHRENVDKGATAQGDKVSLPEDQRRKARLKKARRAERKTRKINADSRLLIGMGKVNEVWMSVYGGEVHCGSLEVI